MESDLAALVFVQWKHHVGEFSGTAKTPKNPPWNFPADCVSCTQTLVLFTALLLELTENEHHVHCASVGSEATLILWEMFFDDGWYKPVEQYSGKDFTSKGQKGDPPIVGTVRPFSLVLAQGDEDCVSKILQKLALFPAVDEEFMELAV